MSRCRSRETEPATNDPSMRIPLPWVIAVLGVSLAGVGIDAVRAKPASSLATAISAHATTRSDRNQTAERRGAHAITGTTHRTRASRTTTLDEPAVLSAALVLQADDCSGNFRMFNLLHRRDVREAIGVAVVWYAGAAGDSARIRAALPAWMRATAIKPVPPAVVFELARMGHRTTPVLLMLDDDKRLRFATQSPRSAREFAGLQRIITGLTWTEER